MIIVGYKRRSIVKVLTLKDSTGATATLGSGDKVRVKIGRNNETPIIDMTSDSATGNGSSVTATNPSTLSIKAADLTNVSVGAYDLEVAIVDASQSNACKSVEHGSFILRDTQTGGVS